MGVLGEGERELWGEEWAACCNNAPGETVGVLGSRTRPEPVPGDAPLVIVSVISVTYASLRYCLVTWLVTVTKYCSLCLWLVSARPCRSSSTSSALRRVSRLFFPTLHSPPSAKYRSKRWLQQVPRSRTRSYSRPRPRTPFPPRSSSSPHHGNAISYHSL